VRAGERVQSDGAEAPKASGKAQSLKRLSRLCHPIAMADVSAKQRASAMSASEPVSRKQPQGDAAD